VASCQHGSVCAGLTDLINSIANEKAKWLRCFSRVTNYRLSQHGYRTTESNSEHFQTRRAISINPSIILFNKRLKAHE